MPIFSKFPLEELYKSGQLPITQKEWVTYFAQVCKFATDRVKYPMLWETCQQRDTWLMKKAVRMTEKEKTKLMKEMVDNMVSAPVTTDQQQWLDAIRAEDMGNPVVYSC